MKFDDIVQILLEKFGEGAIEGTDKNATPWAVVVSSAMIAEVCTELHENEHTYFDSLSCLTGLDNGLQSGTMEVIYNLYSIPYDLHLMLKTSIPRENPEIATVSHIWKTADWHEREAFDLLGIRFTGHPDLRRILLPADWEGHPLRKDYQNLSAYHGIKVPY